MIQWALCMEQRLYNPDEKINTSFVRKTLCVKEKCVEKIFRKTLIWVIAIT